jgi:metallophosphoesterase (TIGR03767 family)
VTLSSDTIIAPGRIRGTGTLGVYRTLREMRAEQRVTRTDLAGEGHTPATRRPILHLAHLTDTHVLDAASPGRFEFANRLYDNEELRHLLPTYRPQEMLSVQALEAMIQAVNEIETSPVTGAPLAAVLVTGDLIDNSQRNELRRFLDTLTGSTVHPTGHAPYEGVAHQDWGDPAYWRPDAGSDGYKQRWGFPTYSSLLEEAARPFEAAGLRHPWLACRGNHDLLVFGTAIPGDAYEAMVLGSSKAAAFPPDYPLTADASRFERFLRAPEEFLRGEARAITPDVERRTIGFDDFVLTLRGARGNLSGPRAGDGFGAARGYLTFDSFEHTRLILLDTVNGAGHWDGSVNARQYAWLEQRLIEVHQEYWDESGRLCKTGNEGRLVVIAAHHPLHTLTNLRSSGGGPRAGGEDEPRFGTLDLAMLLHRFPNVVLLLTGHVHQNRIRPHVDPAGRTAGFWEVTTSALVDWPCEGRLVELAVNGDGTLSILTTMISSAAPADPAGAGGVLRLASIHRELAANDPHAGWRSDRAGTPGDRTTDLRYPLAGLTRIADQVSSSAIRVTPSRF